MPRRTCRPYGHDQTFLLPPSLREWLPADLDLTTYGGEAQGAYPSDPRMRVAVLILLQSWICCCDEPSALVAREA